MEGFDHILNWTLKQGSHRFPGPDGGTCINEAALVAAGFEYRPIHNVWEMPSCFSRPVCQFAMLLNDTAHDGCWSRDRRDKRPRGSSARARRPRLRYAQRWPLWSPPYRMYGSPAGETHKSRLDVTFRFTKSSVKWIDGSYIASAWIGEFARRHRRAASASEPFLAVPALGGLSGRHGAAGRVCCVGKARARGLGCGPARFMRAASAAQRLRSASR